MTVGTGSTEVQRGSVADDVEIDGLPRGGAYPGNEIGEGGDRVPADSNDAVSDMEAGPCGWRPRRQQADDRRRIRHECYHVGLAPWTGRRT